MASCKDCIHFELCDAFERCNGLMKVDAELCGFYESTADSKIFSELENEITAAIESNCRAKTMDMADDFVAYCEGRIHALRGLARFIEELKKKYTEGEQ